MFEKIDAIIFDRAIVERFYGDDGHLRAGFLFKFGAERFEALIRGLRNNSGEIGDVSGGRNFVDVVAESDRRSEKQNRKSKKDGKSETRHERLEHNPLRPKARVATTRTSIAIFEQKCKRTGDGKVGSICADGKKKDNAETQSSKRKDKCTGLKTGRYKTGINNRQKKQDRWRDWTLVQFCAGKPRLGREASNYKIKQEKL